MDEDEAAYPRLFGYASLALVAAFITDALIEWHRAVPALDAWICRTTPTPSGPQICAAAFVVRWITARLPLYVFVLAVCGVVASFAWSVVRPGGAGWKPLLRITIVAVCVLAVAQLIACAGDATCGLSVSCA
ncbi:MAG: hypothetical protein JO060_07755 [Candidatus Eremiobacteraeota bacterium]|nr:hypothetical protein [Candidatus Eremiobacteraeota bacterium]MBV9645957.1 hypothetical protein [Candidatus Eremiobacteraeota bacterium]